MPPSQEENKQASAQAAVDILWDISQILVSCSHMQTKPSRTAVSRARQKGKEPDAPCLTREKTQNCHLDRREISICTSLIERGVNPEALAVSPLPERECATPPPGNSCTLLTSLPWLTQPQTTIKELRKGAQEAKIELETRKQQK